MPKWAASGLLCRQASPQSSLTGGAIPDTSQLLQETTVAVPFSAFVAKQKIVCRGQILRLNGERSVPPANVAVRDRKGLTEAGLHAASRLLHDQLRAFVVRVSRPLQLQDMPS
jgi:hypothetical protein